MNEFKIVFLPSGYAVKDINDDNIDIKVVLTNNKVFSGTLFTLTNIQSLLNKDGCTFFWGDDMLIVKDLSRQTIHGTIDALIQLDQLKDVFTEIGNVNDVFPNYRSFEDIDYLKVV